MRGGQRMAAIHDLVVVGTGNAAQEAALRCRGAGWDVAVIDHQPFGGTCALRGCNPKKVLVGAADALDHVRRMQGNGLTGAGVRIEWDDLMAFKRTFTEPVPSRVEEMFRRRGIGVRRGMARFVGRDALAVGGERLRAKHILLATGAKPAPLPIDGAELLATSDEFLELDTLPGRLVFVGGGYIAAEFCHIAARAGAAVTVVQRGARLLKNFDADLVEWLMRRTRSIGVDVRTGTAVTAVERYEQGYRARVAAGSRHELLDAELVVHAGGRVPDLDALDLAAGGVEHEAGGRIKLNDYLQSASNPAVYAAGDAAARGPMLSPVASYDGRIVAANLLEGNRHTPDYSIVPTVVFTVPPLAMVGLTAAAADERALKYTVRCEETSGWLSARRVNETAAGYKVLIETQTQRILGAHLLGPQADEAINVFAVAMRAGMSAGQLKETLYAYPTRGADIQYML